MPLARPWLPVVLALTAVTYFVLGACGPSSPAMNLRPMLPSEIAAPTAEPSGGLPAAHGRSEVGLGVAVGDGGQAQGAVWGSSRVGGVLEMGAALFGGKYPGVFGAGLLLRVALAQVEYFAVGLQLSGGYNWGDIGLDLAVRLHERVWAYLGPSVSYSQLPFKLPVGLSFRALESFYVNAEFDYQNGAFYSGTETHYFGGALSTSWRF